MASSKISKRLAKKIAERIIELLIIQELLRDFAAHDETLKSIQQDGLFGEFDVDLYYEETYNQLELILNRMLET